MPIAKVSSYVEKERYEFLPSEVVAMAKKSLLDFIASAYAGHQSKASKIALKSREWIGEKDSCTIIGEEKLNAPISSIFINSTLSSCLDIDDGHRQPVGHPGSMVIPPVLAAGEMVETCSGKDIITAIVTGYEIGIRCGIVMNSNHKQLFYGSGGWGVFGSAAGISKVKNLTGTSLENALTIGEVYGPTAQCEKSIASGSMTKESMGWGAVTAFMSVSLAEQGFTGPKNILMDKDNYNCNIEEVFETLGEKYEINNVYYKQYPACKWAHSPIEAAINIKKEYYLDLEDIEEIIIETFSKAITLNHIKPETTEDAQYSIPFTVANALYDGDLEPSHVSEENLENEAIYNIANKIRMEQAEDLEENFPKLRPARLKIKMNDKKIYTEEINLVKGDSENPLLWEDLVEKFYKCSSNSIDYKKRNNIVNMVDNIEDITDIKEFTQFFR